MTAESTMFADVTGRELFVGDVVRTEVDPAFREDGIHGTWAEYQITKAPGGYTLSYVRSEKGAVLPFGYLSCFMTEFHQDELPDIKRVLWAREPIKHPALTWIDDQSTQEDRMRAFEVASKARWEARQKARAENGSTL